MTEDNVIKMEKKQTLLQKYSIPIEHLSYEYVEKCNDDKELEKILKILRSGEEGIYPQLIEAAEARLCKLKPDSRALCIEQPVLRKETSHPEQFNRVLSEMEKWREEMCAKEKEMKQSVSEPMDVMELPAVRSRTKISPSAKSSNTATESKSVKTTAAPKRSPLPRDYSEWEKYSADEELTLMEIEEQKEQEEKERKKREEQLKLKRMMQEKSKQIDKTSKKPAIPANLTPAEREILATKEKDKGNEFFKVADYENAVKYYSASLDVLPTPVAYNNRAIARLKLHQYDAALRDCNEVLKVEPENVKALMRRGIAYQNRNNYQKAYDDFTRVVKLQPENRLAMSLADQMKSKFVAKKRGIRMKIEEEGSSLPISGTSKCRITTSEQEKEMEPWKPPPLPDKVLEAPWGGRLNPPLRDGYNNSWPYAPPPTGPYTEYGLPKNFCNCKGEPEFVRRPQIICLMCHERRVLGLPPLPEGDCNCPNETSPQPVESDTGEHANNTEEKKEMSTPILSTIEVKTKELEEVIHDVDGTSQVNEVTPPPPSIEPVSHAETEVREPQPAVGLYSEQTSDTPPPETPVRRSNVSRLRRFTRTGSAGSVKVAPKYVCATKREKTSETPSSHLDTSIISSAKMNTEVLEAVTTNAAEDQNGNGLQSMDQVPKITSAYEFTRAWGSVKPDTNLQGYARVLKAVAPENLCTVVGNKLDGQMLSLMLRSLERNFIDETETLSQILHNIALLPRFSIAWAFLDSPDKEAAKKMVSILDNSNHNLSPTSRQAFEL